MIYRYEIYLDAGKCWKYGRVNSFTAEEAAGVIKRIYQLESKNNTIVLYEESRDYD